jgi:hypothetical protein
MTDQRIDAQQKQQDRKDIYLKVISFSCANKKLLIEQQFITSMSPINVNNKCKTSIANNYWN